MLSILRTLPFLGLLLQQTVSIPVTNHPEAVQERSLSSRGISAAKIGGANFPDPSIIFTDGSWYAFATRTIGSSIRVQVATSKDFVTWDIVKNSDGSQYDALPNIPSWAIQVKDAATWAPDINILDDGSFVLYFTASTVADGTKHCIGAASASTILGPYTPQEETLVCPLSQGGAIDPAGFYDNGQRYVVYKVDGNSLGHGGACSNTVAPIVATPLILQPVSADGLTLQGTATTLLNHNGAADDGIIENPSIVKAGSTYVLFFSPGCFTTSNYKVDYATASAVTGPYTRTSTPLIVSGDNGLTAPGGADVTRDALKIIFHSNTDTGRALHTATINISGTTVSITG